MNVIRRVVLGIAGVVAVALAISLAAPKAVRAVVSTLVTVTNTPNVTVVNTPSVAVANTVPVTGTVAVSSLPAVQLGGSVNVTNPTDQNNNPVALVTKDSENPARNLIYNVGGACRFSGSNFCNTQLTNVVPVNTVAVVDSVSGQCYIDSGSAIEQVTVQGPGFGEIVVPPGPIVPFGGGIPSADQTFGENLTGYFPNTSQQVGSFLMQVQTNANETGSINDICFVSLQGHLVHQ